MNFFLKYHNARRLLLAEVESQEPSWALVSVDAAEDLEVKAFRYFRFYLLRQPTVLGIDSSPAGVCCVSILGIATNVTHPQDAWYESTRDYNQHKRLFELQTHHSIVKLLMFALLNAKDDARRRLEYMRTHQPPPGAHTRWSDYYSEGL